MVSLEEYLQPKKQTSLESYLGDSSPQEQSSIASIPELPEQSRIDRIIAAGKQMGQAAYTGALETAGGIYQKIRNLPRPVQSALNPLMPIIGEAGGDEVLNQQIQSAQQQYESGDSLYGLAGASRLAGNLAGTLPLGPALKGVGRLPGLLSSKMGRLAATLPAGATQGGIIGGSIYDPENKSGINTTGAIVGAVGGALLNPIAQAIPILTTFKRPDELGKNALEGIIRKLSPAVAKAKTPMQAESIAAKAVQRTVRAMKKQEAKLYAELGEGASKVKLDNKELSYIQNKINSFISEYGDDLASTTKKFLTKLSKEKSLSFNKTKELRTMLRDHKDTIFKRFQNGKIPRQAVEDLSDIYDNMTGSMKNAAKASSADLLTRFTKANEFTKNLNKLLDNGGKELRDSIRDQGAAVKFVNKLMSDKGGSIAANKMQALSNSSASKVRANMLKELQEGVMKGDGTFNLSAFVERLNRNPNYEGVLGQNFNMVKGLQEAINNYLVRGSIDLGSAANFGVIARLTSRALSKLTARESRALRKSLIKLNLINKNEKLKDYFGNEATERLMRMGILATQQPDGSVLVDIEDKK